MTSSAEVSTITFVSVLVVLGDVLEVLGEIRQEVRRAREEPGGQVEQLPAEGTAGSVRAGMKKNPKKR